MLVLAPALAATSARADGPLAEARGEAREQPRGEAREQPRGEARGWWQSVRFSGYLQPQLVWQIYDAASSPNADANGALPPRIGANAVVAQSNGLTTNQDYFRLRRARLKLELEPDTWARAVFEVEPFGKGLPTSGVGSFARNVEAGAFVRISSDASFEVAAGQFNVPFGVEVPEPNPLRPFIDSSFAAGAMFPGDFDIGARATLTLGPLAITSSVLNGVMLGEPTQALLPDLNHGKDATLRVAYAIGPLLVGANGYAGSGQRVDAASLRVKSFGRWAAAADATLDAPRLFAIGRTKIVAGVTYGTNMDRGVAYAFALPDIPADVGRPAVDKHEYAAFARWEQDLSKKLLFGARYDYYTPETSVGDDGRHTLSAVGVWRFAPKLQLMLEYDVAFDRAHAPASQAIEKRMHTFSSVLQVRM